MICALFNVLFSGHNFFSIVVFKKKLGEKAHVISPKSRKLNLLYAIRRIWRKNDSGTIFFAALHNICFDTIIIIILIIESLLPSLSFHVFNWYFKLHPGAVRTSCSTEMVIENLKLFALNVTVICCDNEMGYFKRKLNILEKKNLHNHRYVF